MNISIAFIGMSIAILMFDFLAFSKKKMSASISLVWFAFAVMLILFDVIPMGQPWRKPGMSALYIPNLIFFGFSVFGLFLATIAISVLQTRNRELAMQVSLLNQENEHILQRLEALEKVDEE
jgi:hypothetical protein